MIGAATGATPLIAPIIASVFANSLPVNISVATEREITIPPAPAIPCSKRSIANISIVGAKMQPIVEMIKRYFIYCINIKISQSINMNILKLKSLISEYYKLIVD